MSTILCGLLQAYVIVIFARIILSWFPIEPGSGLASVYSVLYTITEPVLAPVRRIIPPLGGSAMSLDLSPILVVVGLQILQSAIC